jgi:GNAT superfamily N-acetyltransferase
MRELGAAGAPLGVIGYLDTEPVGWCAIAPRDHYPVLERSRTLGRVDGRQVWSITCLFVQRPFRGRGLTVELIEGAVAYAHALGAAVIEAYPVDPRGGKAVDAFAWTGIASAFERAGFHEVARRSPARPIMRLECGRA